MTKNRKLWVSCIVYDDQDRILCATRTGSIDVGMTGVPGGHVEVGETLIQAAHREFHEETGCLLECPILYAISDCDPRGLVVFVTGACVGTPEQTEPDKNGPWRWIHAQTVPRPQKALFAFLRGDATRFR